MASAGGTEEPTLFVKQGSKLHSKMLSKEAAAQLAVPSFRVYYSVASAGAVPFLWESQPGTPKNDSPSASALPPLTPPPSYYSAGRGGAAGGRSRKRRSGLIGAILPFLRRPGRTAPCSSWSSSSWSSSSSNTPPMSPVFTVQSSPAATRGSRGHRRGFSAGGAGDDDAQATPRCFWTERDCCEKGVVRGCGVAVAVRNALATVVGGKPGQQATAA